MTTSDAHLTPPGEVFRADFRPTLAAPSPLPTTAKLLQWNIERGYKLPGIIEELKRIDPDVLSLQEIDVGCDRSGGLDTGLEIAKALGLNYVFLSEFEELRAPVRPLHEQGGGVHGNAIATKYDILDVKVIPHRHHPVDWNNPTHPLARRQPRRGERSLLRVTVAAPGGPLVVYCAHFEVFCGMLARIAQLSDIFADARAAADEGLPRQAILGDLNTMAHGIARLSPNYCCDRMRWLSMGRDEAVLWERSVLSVLDPRYALEGGAEDRIGDGSAGKAEAAPVNAQLLRWGLPADVAADAVNPGFSCPFPAATTVTLDNPAYRWFGVSLMRGKLDWALLRGLQTVATAIGNADYSLSDHKWLLVEIEAQAAT